MNSKSSKSLPRLLVTLAVSHNFVLNLAVADKEKQNVLDLRNVAQVACFPIDSVPGMTSQRDYAQVSLCAVFDMTGSKISRFKTAKARGRKIEIEK